MTSVFLNDAILMDALIHALDHWDHDIARDRGDKAGPKIGFRDGWGQRN